MTTKDLDPKTLYFRMKQLAEESDLRMSEGMTQRDVMRAAEGYSWMEALSRLLIAGFIVKYKVEVHGDYHRAKLIEAFGSVPDELYRVTFDVWDDSRLPAT